MCVIIQKPAGKTLSDRDLEVAYDNNPHGFGFMVYDPEIDRIRAHKSLDKWDKEGVKKIFHKLKNVDAVFHLRWKTKGELKDNQCHPFKVLDKKKHGIDMYFMHNGTITNVETRKGESDTQAFCRTILRPILSRKPSLIRTKAFNELLRNYISSQSKLLFMFGKGEIVYVNKKAGSEREGCWVSNTYSFNSNHRTGYNSTNSWNSSNNVYGSSSKKNTTTSQPAQNSKKSGTPTMNNSGTGTGVNNKSKKQFLLASIPVNVGDKVAVFDTSKGDFENAVPYEGVVVEGNSSTVAVSFKNTDKGTEPRLYFHKDSGESYLKNPSFYAFPLTYFKESPFAKKMQTQSDTTISQARKQPLLEPPKEQQPIVDTPSYIDSLEDKDEATVDNQGIISYQGLLVDSEERRGGEFLNDIDEPEYGETQTSILDFYAMDAEDRFEFFIDDYEGAFNMLQDLVEFVSILEEEYTQEKGFPPKATIETMAKPLKKVMTNIAKIGDSSDEASTKQTAT